MKAALVSAVCSFVLVLFTSGTARAAGRETVVLLGASGPQAESVESAIEAALSRRYHLVKREEYERTARRLGVGGEQAMAPVAAELEAKALVEGTIERRGEHWALTITVYDGADGHVVDRVNEPLPRGAHVTRAARHDVASDLPLVIQRARGASPGAGAVTEAGTSGAVAAPGAAESAAGTQASVGETSEADEAPLGENGADVEGTATSGAGPVAAGRHGAAWQPGLDLAVGMSLIGRSFQFTSSSPQQGYQGDPVPGVRVDLSAYPLAFVRGDGWAGLGVGFVLDRALAISSQLQGSGGAIDTSEQEIGFGLRYRWTFGADQRRPTIRLRAGYGVKSFTIAPVAGVLLPNVEYSYGDLGGGIELPLGTPVWKLVGDVAYLPVLGTGEIGQPAEFGGGSASGVDAQVGLEWRPLRWLSVRASGRYTALSLSFDGSGARTRSGATQVVSGATDQFYGGFLTLGYVY